jgi:hypothetical protein
MAEKKIVSETAIFSDKDGNQLPTAEGADQTEVVVKYSDGTTEHTIMRAPVRA